MNVELVRWPSDPQRLAGLRDSGVPRLLLVSDGAEPPIPTDCLEDWVAAGASESALEARRRALQARARAHGAHPEIDDDGLLRHHDAWVSLSPVEQALTRALLERFGAVVPRDMLASRAWPEGAPTRNALDVHVLAAAPPARAARSRDPHRAVAGLPAPGVASAQRPDRDDRHAELALRALIPDLRARRRRPAAPARAVSRSRARSTSSCRSSIEPTR